MKCRFCNNQNLQNFLDLGCAPPSNAYITKGNLQKGEVYYPLKVKICPKCWLAQTEDYNTANELFDHDYAYFSSVSKSWLEHAKNYCETITERLALTHDSFVVEIASNDGYLLKNFVEKNVPCLGIEPTQSTAAAAQKINVPTLQKFFGEQLAQDLIQDKKADLIIGNNVYAHVPDICDFTRGMKILLADEGTITLEFPHVMELMKHTQFDTVYHEHYSYLSCLFIEKIFTAHDLKLYDVETIPTHGGSLRVYGTHKNASIETTPRVDAMLSQERAFGLSDIQIYIDFQKKADSVKNNFLSFLIAEKKNGKRIVGYGAAAKGNTLMNYAGIKHDLIDYVCDAAPSKQNKFLPGSRLPILHPDQIAKDKPDYVIIFPWNIRKEVMSQLSYIKDWNGKFVTFIPETEIV